MISCNNCNVIVTKINFCSDNCRVAFSRSGKKEIIREKIKQDKQTEKEIVELIDKASKYCKHNYAIGLCKYGCKR